MDIMKLIGKTSLYQWDTGRQVAINPPEGITVDEVHFAGQGDAVALVVVPKTINEELVADIPNILLQKPVGIRMWAVMRYPDGSERTVSSNSKAIIKRPKPEDYVYTETEVQRYENLDKRLKEIEEESLKHVDQNLTEEQRAQARANIGAASAERVNKLSEEISDLKQNGTGAVVLSVEPAEDDIPKIFFSEAIPQTKDDVVTEFRYISKTEDISGFAEFKAQGTSSMSYPKKNMTVKMYSDEALTEKLKLDFKGWGEQSKHVYKANWIDLTHSRNIVSARLWADVVKSRSDYSSLPEELCTSPNQGAIDGFPVKVYSQGIYQGRYTLNIPKDAWMANMDDSLDTHCILCGENYGSGCFRALANIDGSDWSDEVHDTVPSAIKTRWNEVISFVMNSTDEEFKQNISEYFDLESLVDYYIFGLVSCGLDAFGKNQLYFTYDGIHWIASMYDMDSTWGLYWNGSRILASDYARTQYEDYVNSEGNLLYVRLAQLFYDRIQLRYDELKKGVLSIPNIINHFERFTDIAPLDLVKEDYASTTANGAFTGIPSQSTNNIQQIRKFVVERYEYCDTYIESLTPVEEVPCTGITLNTDTLEFVTSAPQTLIATVEPSNTTDVIVWTTDTPSVATVSNGIVRPVGSGSCVITATCGEFSAACSVTVAENIVTDVLYALAEPVTLNGTSDYIDTGVQLYDTDKDFTVLLDFTSGENRGGFHTILHCMEEINPWYGLCIDYGTINNGLSMTAKGTSTIVATANNVGVTHDQVPNRNIKIAVIKNGSTTTFKAKYEGINNIQIITGETGYVQVLNTLLIGAYQDTTGTKGRFWNGTVNDFKVYNYVLSESEITEYLAPSILEQGEGLIYELSEPVLLNGTSDYIDTGVFLYVKDIDYVILMEFEKGETVNNYDTLLHCMYEAHPWQGLTIKHTTMESLLFTAKGTDQVQNAFTHNGVTRIAIAKLGSYIAIKVMRDGLTEPQSVIEGNAGYAQYLGNLLIGAYQDTTGTKGRFWNGTINSCAIYVGTDYLPTDEETNAFLTGNTETN